MGDANAPNELPVRGGFRRVSPLPPPTSVVRLRAAILAAAHGQSDSARQGLARLGAWTNLAFLMNGPWFAGLSQGSATSRRSLQRRLRLLGTRTISLASASAVPRGQLVSLTGKARIPPGISMSYIWANSERTDGNVRLLVEEGHDFFLEEISNGGSVPGANVGAALGTALILAGGGHLLDGERLDDGDDVEVIGFVDQVVDPRAPVESSATREPPRCLAITSGDELALLVRRLS